MKTLCTICARGGSKGVTNKNIRNIAGKPLIQYSFDQANKVSRIDEVILSTDSSQIRKTCLSFGFNSWFKRPEKLAKDDTGKIQVIRHALIESEKHFGCSFDRIIDLDVTSPLRSIKDIDSCLDYFEISKAKILITGCNARKNPFFNMVKVKNDIPELVIKIDKPPKSRQKAPLVFDMNASIYIWDRDTLLKNDSLFTKKTVLFEMPEERSIDIDTPLDFKLVEFLLKDEK